VELPSGLPITGKEYSFLEKLDSKQRTRTHYNYSSSLLFLLVQFFLNYLTLVASFYSDIMCLSMDPNIKMLNFIEEMKDIFKLGEGQSFTMKWLDEEGRTATFIQR